MQRETPALSPGTVIINTLIPRPQQKLAPISSALFHYRQKLRPGTHLLLVAFGHHANHLQKVRQIVGRPGGQELSHGYRAQRRMRPLQLKLSGLQIQRAQARQIVTAQRTEFVQQRGERFPLTLAELRLAVERIKGTAGAMLQNDRQALHPVSLFAVDQMANDHVRAPGAGTLGGLRPWFRQIAEQRVERRGSARQYEQAFFQKGCSHEPIIGRETA
jgi:hypothetical protein